MTRTRSQIDAFKAIPKEKFADKVKKTIVGVFVTGLGIGSTAFFDAPWWVAVGGGLLGATIWSGELVTGALKVLLALIADAFGKLKPGA